MYVYIFNTFRFRIINLKRFQLGTKDLSLKDRFGVRNSHRFVLKTDNKFEKNQWAGFFNDCYGTLDKSCTKRTENSRDILLA